MLRSVERVTLKVIQISSSDWNEVDFPKDARHENDESGKVVAKEQVRVPNGIPSFYEWSRTLITMNQYEKNYWCFAELVSFVKTDKRAYGIVDG